MSAEACTNFKLLSDIVFTQSMTDFNGKSILLHDTGRDDPNRMIIFTNSQLLDFANGASQFQMDGTFKLCPAVYNNGVTSRGQLYSIHARKDGILIPCFYALMARKNVAEYNRLFTQVTNACEFRPESVMMDMEQAVASSISENFPDCEITLCYFHYRQSIWQWIQTDGMSSKYTDHNNTRFRKIVN